MTHPEEVTGSKMKQESTRDDQDWKLDPLSDCCLLPDGGRTGSRAAGTEPRCSHWAPRPPAPEHVPRCPLSLPSTLLSGPVAPAAGAPDSLPGELGHMCAELTTETPQPVGGLTRWRHGVGGQSLPPSC